ncbi:MAG: ComF family protein [Clostridiales bacterium]|jgi:competence protein ComFC|nr:ComF family protein [Clostridiales bacterium]
MSNRWIEALAGMFFPVRCPYCRQVMKRDSAFCDTCRDQLPRQRMPVVIDKTNQETILCAAPFVYQDPVKKAIAAFKFQDRPALARSLGQAMAEQAQIVFAGQTFDAVTGVPLAKAKKRRRGYNQAELLGRRVAEHMGIPYAELLSKPKETPDQHTLTRREREQNLIGAFELAGKKSVEGIRILVCDDIVTTGSTLRECCRTLIQSGAASVQCAALAAVKTRPEQL